MHFQTIINISSVKSCLASIDFLYAVGQFKNLPRNCHSIYTKAKEPQVDRWAGCQGTTNLPDHEISSFLFTQSFFHTLRSLHHCACWFGGCSFFYQYTSFFSEVISWEKSLLKPEVNTSHSY